MATRTHEHTYRRITKTQLYLVAEVEQKTKLLNRVKPEIQASEVYRIKFQFKNKTGFFSVCV